MSLTEEEGELGEAIAGIEIELVPLKCFVHDSNTNIGII